MNTLTHIAAMVALLWGANSWALNTLNDTPLAYVFFALFGVWIPLTLIAIMDDISDGFERISKKND